MSAPAQPLRVWPPRGARKLGAARRFLMRGAGLIRGLAACAFAIVAPAGTPPDVIARLNTEVAKMMRSPAVRAR